MGLHNGTWVGGSLVSKGTDRRSSISRSEIQGICSQCNTARFRIVFYPSPCRSQQTQGHMLIGCFVVTGKVRSWSLHPTSPSSKLVKTIYHVFYCFPIQKNVLATHQVLWTFLKTSLNLGSGPPSRLFFPVLTKAEQLSSALTCIAHMEDELVSAHSRKRPFPWTTKNQLPVHAQLHHGR